MNLLYILSFGTLALACLLFSGIRLAHEVCNDNLRIGFRTQHPQKRLEFFDRSEDAARYLAGFNAAAMLLLFFALWLHTSLSFILVGGVSYIFAYESFINICEGKSFSAVTCKILFCDFFKDYRHPHRVRLYFYGVLLIATMVLFLLRPHFLDFISIFGE